MVSLIQSNYIGSAPGSPWRIRFRAGRTGLAGRARPEACERVRARQSAFHTIIPAFAMREGETLLAFA